MNNPSEHEPIKDVSQLPAEVHAKRCELQALCNQWNIIAPSTPELVIAKAYYIRSLVVTGVTADFITAEIEWINEGVTRPQTNPFAKRGKK